MSRTVRIAVPILAAALALTAMASAPEPAATAAAAPAAPSAALAPEPVPHAAWTVQQPVAAPEPAPRASSKPKPRKPPAARSQTRVEPRETKPGWGVKYTRADIRAVLRATAPAGTGAWEIESGVCIAKRESHGWTRIKNFAGSSATGLWQMLRGTWGGFKGYRDARSAPPRVQAQKFWRLWNGGAGRGHWAGGAYPCW